jgi:phage-related protein
MASIDSYPVSYSFSKNSKTRVKDTSFGMGYRQIVEDNFNSLELTWDVDFTPMDSTAAITLEAILVDSVKNSTKFISWIGPGEVATSNYTAHEIQKKPASHNLWRISCQLRKEYTL